MYYVYILKLKNQQVYTGYTNNLVRRVKEHKIGNVSFTKKRLPIKLVHYEGYLMKGDAKRREKYLKTTEGKRFLKQQLKELFQQIS
jgi:putative endonuclease